MGGGGGCKCSAKAGDRLSSLSLTDATVRTFILPSAARSVAAAAAAVAALIIVAEVAAMSSPRRLGYSLRILSPKCDNVRRGKQARGRSRGAASAAVCFSLGAQTGLVHKHTYVTDCANGCASVYQSVCATMCVFVCVSVCVSVFMSCWHKKQNARVNLSNKPRQLPSFLPLCLHLCLCLPLCHSLFPTSCLLFSFFFRPSLSLSLCSFMLQLTSLALCPNLCSTLSSGRGN